MRAALLAAWGVIGALALGAVAPTAQANSLFDYGTGLSNASVKLGDRTFRIYLHKSRNTFLLEPAMKDMGGDPAHWPEADWQAAAATFVRPLGCVVSQTTPILRSGGAWEAIYYCPLGIDLPAVVQQQGDALRTGAPLKP
jgi:hypothetical protein